MGASFTAPFQNVNAQPGNGVPVVRVVSGVRVYGGVWARSKEKHGNQNHFTN
jgi:hypothetical protein